jgi:hypothetical protein
MIPPEAGLVKSTRLPEPQGGLLKGCMAEHVLHVVNGPTGFKQAGASFMTFMPRAA